MFEKTIKGYMEFVPQWQILFTLVCLYICLFSVSSRIDKLKDRVKALEKNTGEENE